MNSWDNQDPAKMAMKGIVEMLNLFSITVPDDSSLLAGSQNPAWRKRLLQRWARQYIYGRFVGAWGRLGRPRPTLVTDREWDVLILLDACRHDTFCKIYGEVPYIISPGTCTGDWVKGNFFHNPRKQALRDVTLITANPINSIEFFNMHAQPFPFGGCVSVWKDGWDESLKTVTPSTMVDTALEVLRSEPSRLLLHFLQPHVPFIGEPSIQTDYTGLGFLEGVDVDLDMGVWMLVEEGEISIDHAKEAYEGNLKLVLAEVERLLEHLKGKRVVITADHGDLFGEYGLFYHPPKIYVPELTKVPWLELTP